jgi:RHS repeat-associated protein
MDAETGFYYYGARYLDPKTSRWISADPAVGDYIPGAPINDDVRKQNENLPGMGGVFSVINLHVYHYAGNNPVKYIDPNGLEYRWVYTIHKEINGKQSTPRSVQSVSENTYSTPYEANKDINTGNQNGHKYYEGYDIITRDERGSGITDVREWRVFDPDNSTEGDSYIPNGGFEKTKVDIETSSGEKTTVEVFTGTREHKRLLESE